MNNPLESIAYPSKASVLEQLERINKSHVLGRSKINRKLINYLVNYYLESVENRGQANAPKEIEIATKALNKGIDFNPSEDASIRVYISNLRKKLDAYYQSEGQQEVFQITIPPGGYGLEFIEVSTTPQNNEQLAPSLKTENTPARFEDDFGNTKIISKPVWFLSFLLFVSVTVNLWGLVLDKGAEPDKQALLREHSLWQSLFTNQKPTLIVIGDLYFLSELDPYTKQVRALREFGVNNDNDLEEYLTKHPQKQDIIDKAGSAFILKNSVYAIQHILPLFEVESSATIKLASELSPSDLRDFNLIYIGLYKSLGLLDAYFQGSNYYLKKNHPALFHKTSDKVYQITGELYQEYTDYGSFAKFKGPSGNQVYLFAGFSDASIIQMAKYLTNLNKLNSAEFLAHYPQEQSINSGFELIFSASSFDRTDLDSNIVDSGILDHKAIWSMPH